MTTEEKKELLKRYEAGECTPEECLLVERWYDRILSETDPVTDADFDDAAKEIWKRLHTSKVRSIIYRSIAAAAVLLIICMPLYFLFNRTPGSPKMAVKVQDVPAGTDRAILKLADGSQIRLDQVKKGEIAASAGVSISKTSNGKIVYQVKSQNNKNAVLSYNTITTPRGGEFEVILPDGTQVLLNSATSLRYPTQFAFNERRVTLTGEAFFNVQKDPQKPFILLCSGRQEIKVRGTHFNVSCFLNEPISTTLEEGSVEVSRKNSTQKTTLKPGEQSIVTSEGIEVRQVNLKAALAWKEGMFVFRNISMKDVMRQFSRWYDVDIDYSTVPDQAFYGDIPRNLSLLKVLDVINAYGNYQFTLEGRRIVRNK